MNSYKRHYTTTAMITIINTAASTTNAISTITTTTYTFIILPFLQFNYKSYHNTTKT